MASGRNGRFINQKRTNGQISKFGLRMADFILSRIRRLSAVKPSQKNQGLQNCNFIKAGQPQWPFCQASEGRVARARFRNFGAGSCPVASRNNFPGDGRSFRDSHGKNPRRRSHALRCSGAGGWPVGLPETIFRATAKASATASLALASVVLALGAGPSGFPKQFSRQPPSRSLPSFWRWGVAGRASRNER